MGSVISLEKNAIFCVVVVFKNLEVVLLQVGDDALVLVAHGDEQVHQVYFRLDDRSLALALAYWLCGNAGIARASDALHARQPDQRAIFQNCNLPIPGFHCFSVSLDGVSNPAGSVVRPYSHVAGVAGYTMQPASSRDASYEQAGTSNHSNLALESLAP